ncbi:Kelch repeat-containing protein [Reichenbachiella versicolor]|uniref:Kelch repeat-containing protein n=1 Tax=Reichenbachiella versicolor TaxID=1821036 RepID=UPI000D6E6FAC|nr:kelch repeat-containing protein [Reichenbachiella versicolor]
MSKLILGTNGVVRIVIFLFLYIQVISSVVDAQNFSLHRLDFNGFPALELGTSIMFGPDDRLYATSLRGKINIYSVRRYDDGDYKVEGYESIDDLSNIQNHDDDGTLDDSDARLTLGLTVTGTSTNPILYVTSSDARIGAGPSGNDLNLDTNSSIITRYSWNGTAWEGVDIVRGLPRSEENHSANGLEFVTIGGKDYLILAQGGNTNAGAPSKNFAFQCEYALSAAILAIDLSMIESMPILSDNGRSYIYDLPTVDDPTRPNINGITDPDDVGYDGIDIGDPFGGNDGMNQAIIDPAGPVQIFSPGFRNCYDIVVTDNGAVYATENGSNPGWGGFPVDEGLSTVSNDYDPLEPGSATESDGEQIDNVDHLHQITTNISSYTFGSHYGGHPTPIRANPLSAGLYTSGDDDVFRTLKYDPDESGVNTTSDVSIALPANWPPVPAANTVESDWRSSISSNPDGDEDTNFLTWGTNTNGIDEYTASNFSGAMQGNLIAGTNQGLLRRVEINGDGSLKELHENFASGISGNALGITCNGDDEIFAGTIWIATLFGDLLVMEPEDLIECVSDTDPSFDENDDYDFDGYANWDEIDNGSDICNGISRPNDFDQKVPGPKLSDLNDTDDDNDGILDKDDPLQLGDPLSDGDAFDLPVNNELYSDTQLGGYLGLGFTGLMNNGEEDGNWLKWLDRRDDPSDPNPNDILGGAIGVMTMQMTNGTASGSSNDQEKAFQYGLNVDITSPLFIVHGSLLNFNDPLQLYGQTAAPDAELGFYLGDGTQSNYLKFALTKDGFLVQQEVNDVLTDDLTFEVLEANRPSDYVDFYFEVNPTNGVVTLSYSFDKNHGRSNLTAVTLQGKTLEALQTVDIPFITGIIGTSNADNIEVEGTWDVLEAFEKPIWHMVGEDENYAGDHECGFAQAGERFYFLPGRGNKTVYSYDYTARTWHTESSAPKQLNHYQAVAYKGLIWIVSSLTNNSFPSESPNENVWIYDPITTSWIQGQEVPESRRRGSAGTVVYNDKFYVVGGSTNGHGGGYVDWFDEYDPATGEWKTMPDAPTARDHFFAAVVDDKLYAIGGRQSGGDEGVFKPLIRQVDVFDFLTNKWITLDPSLNIPTPRAAPAVVNHQGKLVVLGGEVREEMINGVLTSDALKTAEQFDPTRLQWTTLEDMNFNRHGTQAISSGSGVFITAGSPRLGGGAQRNMEYLGTYSPSGTALEDSELKVSSNTIDVSSSQNKLEIYLNEGNTGVFIQNIEIQGEKAEGFNLNDTHSKVLLFDKDKLNLEINCTEGVGDAEAELVINYDNELSKSVLLTGCRFEVEEVDEDEGEVKDEDKNLSVEETRLSETLFEIYPNPANQEFRILTKAGSPLLKQIEILNQYGATIRSLDFHKSSSAVDISSLNSGIYIVCLKTSNTIEYKRLVVL